MDANEAAMHPGNAKVIGGAAKPVGGRRLQRPLCVQAYKAKLASVIASVDLFCVPTAPTHYALDAVLADPITPTAGSAPTPIVNLLDMCGISVPTGRRGRRAADERTLLAMAAGIWLTAALARDIIAASGLPLGDRWAQPGSAPHGRARRMG